MKKLPTILFFIVVIYNSGLAQSASLPRQEIPEDYGYRVKIGQQVPALELQLANGEKVTSKDMEGKVVMLQFTASWCSVCRKEMPYIENEIWQKHRNKEDFVLIGIDLDEPLKKVNKLSSDMKITYPLALDPEGKIFYAFAEKGAGVTRNVIIDKNGKIVYMTRLYKKDEFSEMKKVIELLLKTQIIL